MILVLIKTYGTIVLSNSHTSTNIPKAPHILLAMKSTQFNNTQWKLYLAKLKIPRNKICQIENILRHRDFIMPNVKIIMRKF